MSENEFDCLIDNVVRLYGKLLHDARTSAELDALRIELFGRKHGIFPSLQRALFDHRTTSQR